MTGEKKDEEKVGEKSQEIHLSSGLRQTLGFILLLTLKVDASSTQFFYSVA